MYWAKGKQDFERAEGRFFWSRISSRMLGTLQFQMVSGVFVAKLEMNSGVFNAILVLEFVDPAVTNGLENLFEKGFGRVVVGLLGTL